MASKQHVGRDSSDEMEVVKLSLDEQSAHVQRSMEPDDSSKHYTEPLAGISVSHRSDSSDTDTSANASEWMLIEHKVPDSQIS